jgi:hypothetical protein
VAPEAANRRWMEEQPRGEAELPLPPLLLPSPRWPIPAPLASSASSVGGIVGVVGAAASGT